jgi:hypothetical protein
LAAEHRHRIAKAVARPVQETAEQRLTQVGCRHRRQAVPGSRTFGEIDQVPNMRLKHSPARG